MATIEKRRLKSGKASYRCKVRRRNQPPLTATFSSKTDAKRWCAEQEAAILSGRHFNYAESRCRTVSEAIDRYCISILGQLKDASGRITHLAWWNAQIGDMILGDVTPSVLTKYREALKCEMISHGARCRRRSNATVNRYFASLRAMFGYARREWQWLDKNPCQYLKNLTEPRGRCRILAKSQRTALLESCDQLARYPEMRPIILLAITTGMRRGEIVGLRWSDIDFKNLRIILSDTKNGEQRSVPLLGPASAALQNWSNVRPLDKDTLVFPSRGKLRDRKPFDLGHAWNIIRTSAGLSDFRFHDLRHTAASYLAMSGATLRDIADILGHKTLAMVQRYSHLTDDHKRAAVSRMVDQIFLEVS